VVDYHAFPRVRADQRQRTGFTRNVSAQGMCLGVEAAEPVGSLLRILIRSVDGRPTLDSIARVVWCETQADGRAWLGLQLESVPRSVMRLVRERTAPELALASA
jgi:hypothetical protein